MRGDGIEMMSIYSGVCQIYTLSTSINPVSPYNRRRSLKMHLIKCVWDALGDRDQLNSEIRLEAMIQRLWRCTWRRKSSEFRNTLGGHDRVNLQMHSEIVIEQDWRCTWGGRNRPSLEIHLEAVIHWVWRCTLRLWPSEFGDALAGYDITRLGEYLDVVDLEGCAMADETLFIG